jgi:hypothetical protein
MVFNKAKGKSDHSPSRISILYEHHLEDFDVLLGRGRAYLHHPGNERMSTIVSDNLARYQSATTRIEKTTITKDIFRTIKTCGDQPARFLRYDPRAGRWTEVDDELARVKVSAALRYKRRPSKAHAASESTESSPTREMVTFPNEEPSSEPTRMIGAHQLYPAGDSGPLLYDEEIIAELGYDIPSSSDEESDPAGIFQNEKTGITEEIFETIQTSGDKLVGFLGHDEESWGWAEVSEKVSHVKGSNLLRCSHNPNLNKTHTLQPTQSSSTGQGTLNEGSSELERRIGLYQQQLVDNFPLLSDEVLLAELGYTVRSPPNEGNVPPV